MLDNLRGLAEEGFQLIKNIATDSRYSLTVQDEYYDYLFDIIQSEFDSLESVVALQEGKKFKDSFALLRSIFEVMLFYWLMVHGKKYRFLKIFTITPKEGMDPTEARDSTLQMWREGKKTEEKPYENIIEMQAEEADKIRVLYEYEGLYDEKDKDQSKEFIPYYFFVLTDHYNQYVKFNSELPSIKTGSTIKDEKNKQNIRDQRIIYSRYIHIDSIIRNMKLNELISEIQEDYVRVHYNFLSSFVHPTKEMFQFKPNTMGFFSTDFPDEIIKEQILLYVCRLQYHFLKILLERIKNYNPKAKIQTYGEHIEKINSLTSYFWFLDNEPSKYDIALSDSNKKMAKRFADKEPDDLTMYYEDPVRRLQYMKNWTG